VRILLDTQCWLWLISAPERFSDEARTLVERVENDLYFSAASAWEIAIKHGIGKLELPGPPADVVPDLMSRTAVLPLPIHHAHALRVEELPLHHRDPFDRLLVAQAQLETLPVLTSDPQFDVYDVEVIRT